MTTSSTTSERFDLPFTAFLSATARTRGAFACSGTTTERGMFVPVDAVLNLVCFPRREAFGDDDEHPTAPQRASVTTAALTQLVFTAASRKIKSLCARPEGEPIPLRESML